VSLATRGPSLTAAPPIALAAAAAAAQSAEHVQGLRNELDALQAKLDQLVEDLPVLDARCRSFLDAIGRIAAARKANSLVLQYHPQLLELLELPQLMETCVRNGYFEEALELDAHVASLRRRLDANPILDSIVRAGATAASIQRRARADRRQTRWPLDGGWRWWDRARTWPSRPS